MHRTQLAGNLCSISPYTYRPLWNCLRIIRWPGAVRTPHIVLLDSEGGFSCLEYIEGQVSRGVSELRVRSWSEVDQLSRGPWIRYTDPTIIVVIGRLLSPVVDPVFVTINDIVDCTTTMSDPGADSLHAPNQSPNATNPTCIYIYILLNINY
jgi:hypothetical protein